MKKKISIFLIALLLFSFLPPTSVTKAWTGGLLNGLVLQKGATLGTSVGTVTSLTDNNTSTSDASGAIYYWYDFSSPVTINSYYLKSNTTNTSIKIEFYDSSGNLKYSASSLTQSGTQTTIPQISDVKRIVLNAKAVSAAWYEFDVFNPTTYDTTAPATPSNFTVEDGDTMEVLRWNANAETDFYGYNVYQNGVKINSSIIKSTVYNATGLTNGQSYNFQVSAVDLAGNESPLTSIVVGNPNTNIGSLLDLKTLNIIDGGVAKTTTLLTDNDNNTSQTASSITYNFSTPVKIGSYLFKGSIPTPKIQFYDSTGALKYTVSSPVVTGAQTTIPQLSDIQKVIFSGSNTSTVYEYDLFNPTTYDTTAPATPSNFTVEDGDTMEVLRWNANAETDFYGYNVYQNGVKINSSIIKSTVFNATGLTNGQSYNFQVSAVDLTGNESPLTSAVVGNPNTNIGSLLDLKTLDINDGGTLTTTNLFTDNDVTTSHTALSITYNFSTPVKVGSYLFKGSIPTPKIQFYDSTGTLKYTASSLVVTGAQTTIPQLSDIQKVVLSGSNTSTVYEYDLFNPTTYDIMPPVTPSGLTSEDGTGMEVLRWNANTDSDFYGYNIYQDGVKLNSTPFKNTVYNITGLTNGQSYNFQISAVDLAGNESPLSNIVAGNPNINTGSLLDLKTVNINDAGTLTTTNLFTDNDVTTNHTALSITYNFPTPVKIGSYLFNGSIPTPKIQFYDSTGTLKYTVSSPVVTGVQTAITQLSDIQKVVLSGSNTSTVYEYDLFNPTTYDTTAPATPSNFTVEDGDTMEVLRWNANAESDFYGYNIYQDGVKINSAVLKNTFYNVTGLTNGQSYNFQISAVDLAGNESPLTSITIGNPNTNVGSLTDLKAFTYYYSSTTYTNTTFTDNDVNTSANFSYSTSVTYTFANPVRTSSYLINGVNIGSISYIDSNNNILYQVNSPNQSGIKVSIPEIANVKKISINSMSSVNGLIKEFDAFSPTTYDTTAPATPSNFTVEDGDTMEVLRWNANAESDFNGYNIYQDGVKLNSTPLRNTVYNATGLTNGQNYNFQISAVDLAGNESPLTTTIVGNPNVNVGSLTDLKAFTYNYSGTNFTNTTFTDNDVNTSANFSYSTSVTYTFANPVRTSSYSLNSVNIANILLYDSNNNLLYQVNSPNQGGTLVSIPEIANVKKISINSVSGSNGSIKEFDLFNPTTYDITPPATPSGFTVEDGDTMGVLRWNSNTESDFYGYNIYQDGVKINTTPFKNIVYNMTNLTNGQIYNFQISAVDLAGNESPLTSIVVGNPNTNIGSLLDLKTLNFGNSITNISKTVTKGTDNDLTTTDSVGSSSYYWYQFSSPVNISSYMLKASGMDSLLFYDSNDTLKYTVSSSQLDRTGIQKSIPQLGDIKKIALYTGSSGTNVLSEIDVFNPTTYDTSAPATPTGLTAEDGTGMEVLRWNANADSDLYGYNVYQNGVKLNSSIIKSTVYNATGLTNGQIYNFQISAVDLAGNESPLTSIVVGEPNANTGSLLDLKTLNFGNSITNISKTVTKGTDNDLTTTDSVGSSSYYWYQFSSPVNISSYMLKASGMDSLLFYDSNGVLKYTVSSSQLDRTGIQKSIPQLGDIKKVALYTGSSGTNVLSEIDVFNPTTYDVTPPATPTGLTVEDGDTKVVLRWNANTDSNFYSYNIYQNGVKLNSTPFKNTVYNVTGLSNGQNYNFQISAVDLAGNESALTDLVGGFPNSNVGSLLDLKTLNYGSSITSSSGTTILATDNDLTTYSLQSYSYYWFDFSNPVNISSYLLKTNTSYSAVKINFYDSNGTLINSIANPDMTGIQMSIPEVTGVKKVAVNVGSATTSSLFEFDVFSPSTPRPPTIVSPNGGETINGVQNISWNASTDADTSQYNLQYQIQLSKDNGTTWNDIVSLTSPSSLSYLYDFYQDPESTQSLIRIRAFDGYTYSGWDYSDANFTISLKPNIPQNFKATNITKTSMNLSWDAVPHATDYQLLRDGSVIYTGTTPSYSDNGLAQNTSYSYEVIARNSYGNSVASPLNVSTTNGELSITAPISSFPTQATIGVDNWLYGKFQSDLVAEDNTGTGNGWIVTVQATPFTNNADNTIQFPSGSLLLKKPTSVTQVDTVSPCPNVQPGDPWIIDNTPIAILQANSGEGMGKYQIGFSDPDALQLKLPSNVRYGDYTSEITWQIVASP